MANTMQLSIHALCVSLILCSGPVYARDAGEKPMAVDSTSRHQAKYEERREDKYAQYLADQKPDIRTPVLDAVDLFFSPDVPDAAAIQSALTQKGYPLATTKKLMVFIPLGLAWAFMDDIKVKPPLAYRIPLGGVSPDNLDAFMKQDFQVIKMDDEPLLKAAFQFGKELKKLGLTSNIRQEDYFSLLQGVSEIKTIMQVLNEHPELDVDRLGDQVKFSFEPTIITALPAQHGK